MLVWTTLGTRRSTASSPHSSTVATKVAVHPTQLNQWKATAIRGLPSLFVDEQQALDATKAAHEQQLTDLYAEIGTLTTGI